MNSQKNRRVIDTPCASEPYQLACFIWTRWRQEARGYPMFKSPIGELFQHFETFGSGFIEMLTLSDLFEYPWLYNCAASDHRCVGAGFLNCVIKVEIRVHISVSAIRFFRLRKCTPQTPFLVLFHIRDSGKSSL